MGGKNFSTLLNVFPSDSCTSIFSSTYLVQEVMSEAESRLVCMRFAVR